MNSRNSLARRHFLQATAALTGATLAAGTAAWAKPGDKPEKPDGKPAKLQDIKHVVVVMMENRSFDHFLGWLPGANGRQAGLTYQDPNGNAFSTYPLAPDYQGCGLNDPDHSHEGGLVEYNGGACDGWLRAGMNDGFCIGYYTKQDLPFLGAAAPAWTTCDNYFSAILAETYPNRIYQHAAQTDRLVNTLDISALPTIWDRLAAAKVSARYYFADVPVLALWGTKYAGISRLLPSFFSDCASGKLPAVSFVDPSLLGEDEGVSNDDHPHADVRNGEAFLNSIYTAVTRSPAWANTVLVVNFDEWGGFFEHVSPPVAPIPPADAAAGNVEGLRGFRVPALVISPFARRSFVAHGLYDHTSVLKLIESRWGLAPLTVRDQTANNLADVLDFTRPANLAAPQFSVPVGPFGAPCPVTSTATTLRATTVSNTWGGLRAMATKLGFPR